MGTSYIRANVATPTPRRLATLTAAGLSIPVVPFSLLPTSMIISTVRFFVAAVVSFATMVSLALPVHVPSNPR